ncbi:dyslexia-associated protein KIAA0319-like protein isoform X2 [Branchiostoma lanceolatum]|uniref:dyslexia-associated protein KIAA0319-like protein isoform X2 n=1 Tax=Branchiostoma lanceolatum TaxID=7740 RepID=UPI003456CDA7
MDSGGCDRCTILRRKHHLGILLLTLSCLLAPKAFAAHEATCREGMEYDQSTPSAGVDAGTFNNVGTVSSLAECSEKCCDVDECDVAWMYGTTCFTIACKSDEACKPEHRDSEKFMNSFMMVVERTEPAADEDEDTKCSLYPRDTCPWDQECKVQLKDTLVEFRCQCKNGLLRDPLRGNSCVDPATLETDMDRTLTTTSHEHIPSRVTPANMGRVYPELTTRHRAVATGYGLPEPVTLAQPDLEGRTEGREGEEEGTTPYLPEDMLLEEGRQEATTARQQLTSLDWTAPLMSQGGPENSTTPLVPLPRTPKRVDATTPSTVSQLVVSAGENKVIRLPQNSVTLHGFTVPEPPEGVQYVYEWSLLSGPEEYQGEMEGRHTQSVHLSQLTSGHYMFMVTVVGDDKYGEGFVNVTVEPPTRVNTPPVAIVQPKQQEVSLPNSAAILDGSQSTDDDGIVDYHWEEVKGPLREEKASGEESILRLNNLIPGSYVFRLTVTDSDGETDSTTANVTVHKETDYPPVANAGPNLVIQMPQNSVVLNGSKSTDDKGIVSYEWVKEGDNVADMQGTRTSILHVSNMEVGDYTFTLTVTDSAEQEDDASVTVIVQPENNQPPVADAGPDKELTSPDDTTTLDGGDSTDDQGVVSYEWTKTSGPSSVDLQNTDQAVAMVAGLVTGTYEFTLKVCDEKNLCSRDTVTVQVKEDVNHKPRADAGGDVVYQLPQTLIIVDGSKSSDDHGIVDFLWTRDPQSPAAGIVLNGSDHKAVLQLTNLVEGRYVFHLKVTDAKGLFDTDSATVIVKKDVHMDDLVELALAADITSFTEGNKAMLVRQLAVLIDVMDTDIRVQEIKEDMSTGNMIVVFVVVNTQTGMVQNGGSVLAKLRRKLKAGSEVLDFKVVQVDTVVCQNNCSGHGVCNSFTKTCQCDSFWVQNPFKAFFADKVSNCDWSILYVIVIAFGIVVGLGLISWGVFCLVRNRRRFRRSKRHRYTLLDEIDDKGEKIEMYSRDGKDQRVPVPQTGEKTTGQKQNNSLVMSESDDLLSDEETTLFENKKKPNGTTRNGLITSTLPKL